MVEFRSYSDIDICTRKDYVGFLKLHGFKLMPFLGGALVGGLGKWFDVRKENLKVQILFKNQEVYIFKKNHDKSYTRTEIKPLPGQALIQLSNFEDYLINLLGELYN